jgi:glutaredoxin
MKNNIERKIDMGNIILYEHGCPNCLRLKSRLDEKGIKYEDITDIELMKSKGFTSAPKLEIDGVIMDFKTAMNWAKEQ